MLKKQFLSLGDPNKQKELFERALPILEKRNHPVVSRVKSVLNTLSNSEYLEPLSQAAKEGNLSRVKSLIENGSSVNDKDGNGMVQLHYAANHGNLDVLNVLLKGRADATQVTNKGNTALHIAANVEVVRSLLEYGAIYNIKNKEGKAPIDLAKNDDIRNLLNLTNELFEDAKNGNLQVISKLHNLEKDKFIAVTNARNDQGHTLLQVAVANQHRDIAIELSKILKNPGKVPSSSMESINVAGPSSRSFGNLPS